MERNFLPGSQFPARPESSWLKAYALPFTLAALNNQTCVAFLQELLHYDLRIFGIAVALRYPAQRYSEMEITLAFLT